MYGVFVVEGSGRFSKKKFYGFLRVAMLLYVAVRTVAVRTVRYDFNVENVGSLEFVVEMYDGTRSVILFVAS